MKKIISGIIIIIVLYIIIVFKAPTLANDIEKLIGLNGLNQRIINIKNKLDNFGTKLPTKNDLSKYYSGTINTIHKTKENIDQIRQKANELKGDYKNVKNQINQAQNKIGEIKNTVNKITKIGDNLNKIISHTGTVN